DDGGAVVGRVGVPLHAGAVAERRRIAEAAGGDGGGVLPVRPDRGRAGAGRRQRVPGGVEHLDAESPVVLAPEGDGVVGLAVASGVDGPAGGGRPALPVPGGRGVGRPVDEQGEDEVAAPVRGAGGDDVGLRLGGGGVVLVL